MEDLCNYFQIQGYNPVRDNRKLLIQDIKIQSIKINLYIIFEDSEYFYLKIKILDPVFKTQKNFVFNDFIDQDNYIYEYKSKLRYEKETESTYQKISSISNEFVGCFRKILFNKSLSKRSVLILNRKEYCKYFGNESPDYFETCMVLLNCNQDFYEITVYDFFDSFIPLEVSNTKKIEVYWIYQKFPSDEDFIKNFYRLLEKFFAKKFSDLLF